MQINYSYPWYLQESPVFTKLYTGFYEVATNITCLDVGDFFNYRTIPTGVPLYQLGRIWGVGSVLGYYDGLVYDIDKWSEDKKWTGQLTELDDNLTRNFLRMKMFIQGRAFNLILIRDALAILLEGEEYSITVTEELMGFTINLSAPTDVIGVIQSISNFDNAFLGKPSGIHYSFNYTATDA